MRANIVRRTSEGEEGGKGRGQRRRACWQSVKDFDCVVISPLHTHSTSTASLNEASPIIC